MRCLGSVCTLLFSLFVSTQLYCAEPQWIEIASPNFRVYTDGGEKRGREIALHFEQMRFVFGKLFQKAKIHTGAPVRVLAFRNKKGFQAVAPVWTGKGREVPAFYLKGNALDFVALDLSAQEGWTGVFHEYAHLLLNSNMTDTPVWFDEGFAEFYSTIKIENSQWVVGSLPEYAPQELRENKFIPIVELFSAGHDSPLYSERDHVSIFYAQSWLAVEYFWFDPNRTKQLVTYFQLINEKVPVADALKRAFGKDPAELDKDLSRYFREGKAMVTTYKTPPALDTMEMKVTPITALDARANVAELQSYEQGREQQGQQALEDVLRQNPDQAIALRARGYVALRSNDPDKAITYLERAASLGSDDPQVYFYWAMALQMSNGPFDPASREKMRTALERCISLDPDMADAYSLLAFTLAQSDYDAAVKALKTAISLSPRKMENYINLASLNLMKGKYDEASSLLQQLKNSPQQGIASQANAMLAQIERMKALNARSTTPPNAPQAAYVNETADADDYELTPFAGNLVGVVCKQDKITITVNTGKEKLVLSGDTRDVSIGGKPLYCDLKGGKVHGHYNSKKSELIAVFVE